MEQKVLEAEVLALKMAEESERRWAVPPQPVHSGPARGSFPHVLRAEPGGVGMLFSCLVDRSPDVPLHRAPGPWTVVFVQNCCLFTGCF